MKFWQYIVGTGISILIFSGAVFSEYSKYQNIAFLEKNPFSEFKESSNDVLSDNGEFIKSYEGSKIEINEKNREIFSGKVFLGGSLFDGNKNDNFIKFGDMSLKYKGSNIIINKDIENKETEILNYGRTIKLYFGQEKEPFIIPSEYSVLIDETGHYLKSKNKYFYEYSNLFDLKIIDWSDKIAVELNDSVEQLYEIRSAFKKFATEIPNTWKKHKIDNIGNFAKKTIRGESKSEIEKYLLKLYETTNIINKKDIHSNKVAEEYILDIKRKFSENKIQSLLGTNDNWVLFEKSQKAWLPIIDKSNPEWIYQNLWDKVPDNETQILISKVDNLENLKSKMSYELSENEFVEFKNNVKKQNFENIKKEDISFLRRRIFFIIKNQIESFKTINEEYLEIFTYLAKQEIPLYSEEGKINEVEKEIIANLVEEIGSNIKNEDSFSREIVKIIINALEKNFNWESYIKTDLIKEELGTIISDIELVGLSGLTPEEVRTMNNIREGEKELTEVIQSKKVEKVNSQNLISTSKELWEFLKEEGVNIEINSFRTSRNSLEFKTNFENTEKEKRKISGTFDYNGQIFTRLNLGEAYIRKIQPHAIQLWIKSIAGKFEPKEDEKEIVGTPYSNINQNSRKSIINKDFLKKLLNSLDFEVSKNDILATNDDASNLIAKNILMKKNGTQSKKLSLEYGIEENMFFNVFFEENKNKIYLSSTPIDGKTLQKFSLEIFKDKE